MYVTMKPPPGLQPFVARFWTNADDGQAASSGAVITREAVLPSGMAHLAIRLSDASFDISDSNGALRAGPMVACGLRSQPYYRLRGEPVISVGVQLRPGAGPVLFGMPADEMADMHVPLDDLWGRFAHELRERLAEAPTADERLTLFARLLESRLQRARGMHPAVALALHRFADRVDVAAVVEETDYSHRHFNVLFRQAVGLSPKRYCRILRFREALESLAASPEQAPAELALDQGYSDQAHFNRDFRAFAHMTPGAYRRSRPNAVFHVPFEESEIP
ncbi:helix-turn-helix domain-containing protein [Aestuariispira ectoiniformans]|uniref:helix-turn-helix domain-containing protein n=1 Tax=Aestuariispira ectoiniformans TaxID=2775080 RepID=UPI00223B5A79|nr:helix-turn-helix domain-containing protein [Aestuariispira ectoiniformans]